MLYWAVVFLVLAIIAAVFGFGGISRRGRDHREGAVLRVPGGVSRLPVYGAGEKTPIRVTKRCTRHRSE